MILPQLDGRKLLEMYSIDRRYDYVWIPEIFDKLTYAEFMECRKIIKRDIGISVKIDVDHMLMLARSIERLEQRISDLELHNELEN